MFYCTRCGKKTAGWQNDFDNEDLGIEEEGITSFYTCHNCDSEIQVITYFKKDKEYPLLIQ